MITAKYILSYDEAGQETYTDPVEVLLKPEAGDDGNEILEDGESATQVRLKIKLMEFSGGEMLHVPIRLSW